MAGINRRDFFKMIGVTSAASVAGCDARVPTENVLPYVVQPRDITPGVVTYYATACGGCAAGCGTVARVREGRVILVEGNTEDPVTRGGICAAGTAAVQDTYDPDRLQGPTDGGKSTSWDAVTEKVGAAVKGAGRGGVAWLGRYRTGSLGRLIGDFVEASKGTAVHWEPLGYAAIAGATEAAFGVAGVPRYAYDDAHTIVSFGAEFLHTWLAPVAHAKSWARARDPENGGVIAQFFAIEPRVSNTSARADTWWGVAPGTEAEVARGLAKLVAGKKGNAQVAGKYLASADPKAAASAAGIEFSKLEALADKLAAGPSVIFPGGASTVGAGDLAVATLVLNAVCENFGKTVLLGARHDLGPVHAYADVEKLLADCTAGKIKVLFLDGLDPVFSLPEDAGVAKALTAVPTLVIFGNSVPEGAPGSAILLPPGSAAETWGDTGSVLGRHGLQQPAMLPLYDTRSVGDSLLAIAVAAGLEDPVREEASEDEEEDGKPGKGKRGKRGKGPKAGVEPEAGAEGDEDEEEEIAPPKLGGSDAVASFKAVDFQRYIAGRWYSELFTGDRPSRDDFTGWWRDCLQRGGFYPGVSAEPDVSLRASKLEAPAAPAKAAGDYALTLFPHSLLHDGRHANKAWMQEIPHPMSGFTWGTWAEISPGTAEKLGVTGKDTVRVSNDQGTFELGVRISKGMRDDAVGVVLGNGHEAGNRYSKGWGVNPVRLLKAAKDARSGDMVWSSAGVSLSRGQSENPLECLKGSEGMDDRPVALDSYYEDVLKTKGGNRSDLAAIHRMPEDQRLVDIGVHDMFPEPEHPKYRFALHFNLDNCTGCGACETACMAENNIPAVGPRQHQKHRYMNWIRLSRFWEGEGENPDVRFIPVMCQHCSHAPCEGVCPVLATYHNIDGLNAMVYNRCVGTRYCANNCPYAARRFNYHTFRWPETYTLMLNPAVSTREMGVMEKCTFCIQRIRDAKGEYRGTAETAPDSALRRLTACAAACPSDAITFGNRKDAEAEVAKLNEHPRTYTLFGELNTKPGVQYMTKINFHRTDSGHHGGGGHGDDHGDSHGDSHGDAGAHGAAEDHGAGAGEHGKAKGKAGGEGKAKGKAGGKSKADAHGDHH
jgi:Fe-S-cluster-containing dehydrogenase component/anaerobic selenocysteine-containing dehydrogenase